MLIIQQYIDSKQQEFRHHPFFEKLQQQEDFSIGMSFTPKLTFWAMAFQDILRIIPSQLTNVSLRRIANHHKHEDAGHDKWFLQDVAYLNKNYIFNIEWLFSPEHQRTRELTYRIISEVFHGSEIQKIALVLTLESTGHVFFENISKFAKIKGKDSKLQYFSSYHLEVELNHVIFEEKLKNDLERVVLSSKERQETIAMIDRVYTAFYALFNYLMESFTHATDTDEEKIEELEPMVA